MRGDVICGAGGGEEGPLAGAEGGVLAGNCAAFEAVCVLSWNARAAARDTKHRSASPNASRKARIVGVIGSRIPNSLGKFSGRRKAAPTSYPARGVRITYASSVDS